MDKEDVWYKDILQVNKDLVCELMNIYVYYLGVDLCDVSMPALNKIQDKNIITLKILKTLRKMSLF